jgi:hypothetical protein
MKFGRGMLCIPQKHQRCFYGAANPTNSDYNFRTNVLDKVENIG